VKLSKKILLLVTAEIGVILRSKWTGAGAPSFEIVWRRNPLANRSRLKDEHADRGSQHGERRHCHC
jgi:hypothetical protein